MLRCPFQRREFSLVSSAPDEQTPSSPETSTVFPFLAVLMPSSGGLVFVNVSHPDEVRTKGTQRAIRRRVMRDIGKSRRKPKGPPAMTFAWQETPILDIWEPIPLSLDSNPLPVELNSRARELIHFMQSEADYCYRPFRSVWFSMALHDGSAFKLCMANAAMFLDKVHHPESFQYERSAETLKYYGQCVGEVTHRLADPVDCTSEGLVTTVLGLICHDLYVGTWDRWAYHIQGLKRIAQLRGGLHKLSRDLHLFACWFDAIGSVVEDSPPRLSGSFSSSDSRSAYWTSQSPSVHPPLDDMVAKEPHAGGLVQALGRVAAVSDFVNAHHRQPGFWKQENDLSSLSMLGPATHILLSMPRFDTSDTKSFEFAHELTRLASLILLAGLKSVYELAAAEMGLLQDKLYRLLRGQNLEQGSFLLPDLQIWALVTAALFQHPGREKVLYCKEISRRMAVQNFRNGAAAVEVARSIIWIEALAKPCITDTLIFEIDVVHLGST